MVSIGCDVITIDEPQGHSDPHRQFSGLREGHTNPKPRTIHPPSRRAPRSRAEFRRDLASTYRIRTHARQVSPGDLLRLF